MNLSGQKDKCAELEEHIDRLKKERAKDGEKEEDTYDREEKSTAHELKVKELEKERSQLKQELQVEFKS